MSLSSSDIDLIASLKLAQKQLYRFVGPFLIGIGTVSCILSLLVFTKKNLRKNTCSIYMIAFHLTGFALIFTSLVTITLTNGYNINPSSYNLIFCRFIIYITFILDILFPSCLILASIDRILVTSPNASTRQRSTPRLAYICIISVTLFWILFHSHALFLVNIIQIGPNSFICYFNPGLYLSFTGYYSLVIKAIFIPLLMGIFGLWTLKNIRNTRHVRMAPALPTIITTTTTRINTWHSTRSRDHHLIRILLIDITIYIIFNLSLAIILMYQQLTQYNIKNSVQNQIETFVRFIAILTSYIPFCISCYTNMFGSKTFRNEIKNIFICN